MRLIRFFIALLCLAAGIVVGAGRADARAVDEGQRAQPVDGAAVVGHLPLAQAAMHLLLAALAEVAGTAVVDRQDDDPLLGKIVAVQAAREGVAHAWLVDPVARTLEVYRLAEGRWVLLSAHEGTEVVRAEPFEELEIVLSDLWVETEPPTPQSAAPAR